MPTVRGEPDTQPNHEDGMGVSYKKLFKLMIDLKPSWKGEGINK